VKPRSYFYDNPASGPGHFSQHFAAFFFGLVRVVFKVLFRYQAAGLEVLDQLPAGQGAILASNHRSYLDPLFVLALLRPRPIRYMSKEEFFQVNPIVGRGASWLGVYPVKRDSADMTAVKRSVKMLKRGELVGIFPEGTRIRFPGQVATYHPGIALIAAMADAPVIPLRSWGTERIRPPGKKIFRTPQVTLRFGQPLRITDEPFASLPKEQRFPVFTEAIMQRIYELEPLPGSLEARQLAQPKVRATE